MLKVLAAALLIAGQSSLPMVTIPAPRAAMHLWVASSLRSLELGLMDRTHLDPAQGMLFVFWHNKERYFWMKDTLMPLDMVFVERNGLVRAVFSRVPILPPGIPNNEIPLIHARAQYVIELGAGETRRIGIVAGEKLAIPKNLFQCFIPTFLCGTQP